MLSPIRRLSATPFRRLLSSWVCAMSSTPETGSGSINSTPETGSDISNFSFFHTGGEHAGTTHAPLYPDKDEQHFNIEAFKNLILEDSCNGLLLFTGERKTSEAIVVNPATNTRMTIPLDFEGKSPWARIIFTKLAYYPLIRPDQFAIVIGLDEDCDSGRHSWIRVFYSATSDYKEFELPHLRFSKPRRIYPCRIIHGSLYLGLNSWEAIKIGIITRNGEQPGKDEERIYWPLPIYTGLDGCAFLGEGRLFGESGGNYQFASTDRSQLLVWMRKGLTWVLKHSTDIRSLINKHMEANPRPHPRPDKYDYYYDFLEDGGVPYAFPKAFHPDLDVVFLQVERKMYAWHALSYKFEEVCSELPDPGLYCIYPYTCCLVDPLVADASD